MGVAYFIGIGVPLDYAKAAKWYRLAAENGHVKAHGSLGHMYFNGLGVEQDFADA